MTQPARASGLESLIEKAKEDLGQRLSIDVSQINLLEAEEVTWPDASLGCPQPGMRYKQVPEDGALIVLEAQGTTYEYHNGGKTFYATRKREQNQQLETIGKGLRRMMTFLDAKEVS